MHALDEIIEFFLPSTVFSIRNFVGTSIVRSSKIIKNMYVKDKFLKFVNNSCSVVATIMRS